MTLDCYRPWLMSLLLTINPISTVSALENNNPTGKLLRNENLIIPLSSKQLVARVLQASPRLKVAHAAWQASLSRIEQKASFEDPLFSYTMAPQTIANSRTEYGQRLEISQKLPWPGKLQLRNDVASHKADASKHSIHSLRLQLSGTARASFSDWYYIHQAIKINKHNQRLLQEFNAIATRRYDTGLASKQDTLRAEMQLALLEHQAIALSREQSSIRAQINTLLNKRPDSVLAEPENLTAIKALPPLKLLQKQALAARPELKVYTALLDAAKSKSALAHRNNYPDMRVKAGYNSLWENTSKHFTVGIGFNLPLFQSKHRAAENEARAQIKQTEWQRVDFIARLREIIHISYAKTNESLQVLNLYQHKLRPLAEATLAVTKSDYQAGKGDFLSLIMSEKNYMQTQLQTAKALADTHRRLAELDSAVGRIPLPINETQ